MEWAGPGNYDTGSHVALRGRNPPARRSIRQPRRPLAGSADIHSFGARLRRAAAAAEGGAKLKMADKTPGGSQKASSKVIS
jgi:hypothetical protein